MKDQKIINGLNDLLKKNYDAEKGYNMVAEKTEDPVLAAFMRGKASNRYTYGHQIKDIIREMEGEIDKGTSTMGDLHRAWIDVKTALSSDKNESLLEEVERGEEQSLEEYNTFLSQDELPQSIRRIVTYQRNNIAHALGKVDEYEAKFA